MKTWQARILGGFGVTLREWNERRERELAEAREQLVDPARFPNGLTCDECGDNLYDTNQQLQGTPVRLVVKCQHCAYKGARYE